MVYRCRLLLEKYPFKKEISDVLHYRDHIKAELPVTAAALPHIQLDSPMTLLLVQTWISFQERHISSVVPQFPMYRRVIKGLHHLNQGNISFEGNYL